MKTNKNKFFAAILAFSLITSLFPLAAWASLIQCIAGYCTVDVGQQATDVMQQMEDRYGITSDVWRTAKRKVSAPRVELFFDNTNPKPGEKVTAHAIPEYFKNDPQNLYYTWYIIHTTDGNIKNATNSISDGKIEAARLMARGDYDPNLDGQTYADSDKDPDNDGWPAIDNAYDEGTVAAPMGGADGVGGLVEGSDNIEPYTDANSYCSSRGNHTVSECNLYTEKSSFNQYYNLKTDQAGDFCKACQASLSFTSILSPTGSPSGSVNNPNNQCCYLISNPEDTDYSEYDAAVSYCPTTYNSAYESCYDYADLQTYNSNQITSCLNTEYQACKDDWDNLHANPAGDEAVGKVSRCYKHNFGTNNPNLGFRGYIGATNSFESDDSGTDAVVDCVHKWKDAPGYTSGSGKFPTGEEEYWKTDPADPDTDGDGFPDEADVIGLGQQDLTWNYQSGDRVGVVVEGTSMIPVDEKSAYYKIMWGYLDVCDSTKNGLMDKDECEDSADYGYGYLATKAPNEQGDDKLKVSLSFSPENPLADPSSENSDNIADDGTISDADQITVSSSIDNTTFDPASLYYTWQISKGDPTSDSWTEIKDIGGNFNVDSPSAGMDLPQFGFTPKKDVLSGSGDTVYFKVTLTASKTSGQDSGRGRSSVIIPVNKQGIRIDLYKVDVKSVEAFPSPVSGRASVGEKICTDGLYKTLCPAVKGQMLAAKVSGSHYGAGDSDFSWTLDGAPYHPPSNASGAFEGWNNTTVFFPITKEENDIEEISVTATSKDELKPATGTRRITVVHPALFIKSADASASWPKVYAAESQDSDATQNIASSTAFESPAGTKASYYLDFVPYYLLGEDANSKISWSVNGSDITSVDFYQNNPNLGLIDLENNDRTIKLPVGDVAGNFTTLSAAVKKYWDDSERSLVYVAWGIAPETLSGESTVTIESVSTSPSSENPIGFLGGSGQALAAIGTHLPHYFMYLLRLALTLAVMFVASAGFYGLSQKLNLADEKK